MNIKYLVLAFFISVPLYANREVYPLMKMLNSQDLVFRQLQQEIKTNLERWAATDQANLPIQIYRYQRKKDENIFSVAAKSHISYDAIATLNQWDSPLELWEPNQEILIPNNSGIFVLREPNTSWEQELYEERHNKILHQLVMVNNKEFYYYPAHNFSPLERKNFLNSRMLSPLNIKLRINSDYGYRKNPLTNTGREFHDGIDLHAPFASPVRLVKRGKVTVIDRTKLYGLYIRVSHGKDLETVYAHLSAVTVSVGDELPKATIIAFSGNSGRSTGSHLHFSVFYKNKSVDPKKYLNL